MKKILIIIILLFNIFMNAFAYKQVYINPEYVISMIVTDDKIANMYHIAIDTINETYSISFHKKDINEEDLEEFKYFLLQRVNYFKDLRRIIIDHDKNMIIIKSGLDDTILKEKDNQ